MYTSEYSYCLFTVIMSSGEIPLNKIKSARDQSTKDLTFCTPVAVAVHSCKTPELMCCPPKSKLALCSQSLEMTAHTSKGAASSSGDHVNYYGTCFLRHDMAIAYEIAHVMMK